MSPQKPIHPHPPTKTRTQPSPRHHQRCFVRVVLAAGTHFFPISDGDRGGDSPALVRESISTLPLY